MPETINELVTTLTQANEAYRSGHPTITDLEYDQLTARLAELDPENPYLHTVEPEPVLGKTIPLPEKMLSTQKAYTLAEVQKWYAKVQEAAVGLGLSPDVDIRITSKLDGFAAIAKDEVFATRGDGLSGTDLSHVASRGLLAFETRFQDEQFLKPLADAGKGEIVVNKFYFAEKLQDRFENTRNVIAAAIKEGELDEDIASAISTGQILFIPFDKLPGLHVKNPRFTEGNLDSLWRQFVTEVGYDVDGIVFEATDLAIKEAMGATSHHYRWQLAYKRNTEFHSVRVQALQWQTSKNGRITPVVLLEPTRVSGVTISRATGHNAGNILDNQLGPGALVEICRSGQVIPYIQRVLEPTEQLVIPDFCPSCGAETLLEGDHLSCSNTIDCPAQIERTIEFFFKAIGNCDGFGPAVIAQLHQQLDVASIYDVLQLEHVNYTNAGIGAKTAENLLAQIAQRKQIPLEDWRFLAAWSLPGFGESLCEKLLTEFSLNELFEANVHQVGNIPGFGPTTSDRLVTSLAKIRDEFFAVVGEFTIKATKGVSNFMITPGVARYANSPIAGKLIVFTGSMSMPRKDMESQAKSLGALVGSSVTGKTDYLVCGENVGSRKMTDAGAKGARVITEGEYWGMINPIVSYLDTGS